jgi:hypothetical protein
VAKTKVRTDQLVSVLRQTFNNQSGLSPIFDFSLNGYSEAQQRLINSVIEKSSSPLASRVASVYPGDGGNTNIQFLHVITNKDDTFNRVPLAFIYDKPTVPGDNGVYGIYHIVKNDVVNPLCEVVDIRPVDTVNGTQLPFAFLYREGDPVNRTGKVVSARPFFVSQGVDSLDLIGYTVAFRSGGQASPYYSAGNGFYSYIAKTPLTIFSGLVHSRFDILGRDVTLDINTNMYGLDFRISNTTGSAKSFILNSGDPNNSGGLLTGCRMIFNASSGDINLSIGDKGNVLGYDLIFQAAEQKTLNITMGDNSYIYGFRTVFRTLGSDETQGTLNVNLQATGANKESIVFGYVFSTHSNVNFNGTDVTKHYVMPIRSYNISNLNNVTWFCEEWMLLFSSVVNSRVRVRDILVNNATAQNFICDYLHPYGDITVSPTVEGFRWAPLGTANSGQAFNSFTATFIASSWDGANPVYRTWRMRAEGTVAGTPLSLFSFIRPNGSYSLRLGDNGDVQIPGFMTLSGITAPSTSDSGTGRIYFDSTTNRFKVSEDGGSYDFLVYENLTQTLVNKTLTTPIISDFTNAQHNHQGAAGGGVLDASAIQSGVFGVERGGTGISSLTGHGSKVIGVKSDETGYEFKVLGANYYRTYDPESQNYSSGDTVLQTLDPDDSYISILPERWVIPATTDSNLVTKIIFVFSDDTEIIRSNTSTGTDLVEKREDVEFNKSGLYIKQVKFVVTNTGSSSITADIGAFIIDGEQF